MLKDILTSLRNLSFGKKLLLLLLILIPISLFSLGVIIGVVEALTGYKIIRENAPHVAATPSPTLSPSAIPTGTPTRTERERARIEDAVKSATGRKLRKVEINKNLSGAGYVVLVDVAGTEGFSAESTRSIIEQQSSEVYAALYETDLKVDEAVVSVYFSDRVVYKSQLVSEAAARANWKEDRAVLLIETLPNLWKVLFANPSLR